MDQHSTPIVVTGTGLMTCTLFVSSDAIEAASGHKLARCSLVDVTWNASVIGLAPARNGK